MELPEEIIENAKNISIYDFDNLGYIYCGYVQKGETETLYYLPYDLKNKAPIYFDVNKGFCDNFDSQLRAGLWRSAPLILSKTLSLEDIDKLPLELFADPNFAKRCITFISDGLANSKSQPQTRNQIIKLGKFKDSLRLKLKQKSAEAKKEFIEK